MSVEPEQKKEEMIDLSKSMSSTGHSAEIPSHLAGVRLTGILPIHNDADVVGEVLDSIASQILPIDELIVVLDACTDNSRQVVESRKSRLTLVIFERDVRNVSSNFNFGLSKATYDLIVFFGSHWVVPPNYTRELVRNYSDGQWDLVSYSRGLWVLSKSTVSKYGMLHPFGHAEEHEYIHRIRSRGGRVLELEGDPKYGGGASKVRRVYGKHRTRAYTRDLVYGMMMAQIYRTYGNRSRYTNPPPHKRILTSLLKYAIVDWRIFSYFLGYAFARYVYRPHFLAIPQLTASSVPVSLNHRKT